jgi:hypothetical protein
MTRRHRPHGHRGRRTDRGDEGSILDLQRLVGNAAVTAAITRLRAGGNRKVTVHPVQLDRKPMPPAKGIQQIRDKGGGSQLGLTIRAIEDAPPLFRAEPPTQGKGGWTTKAYSVHKPPEPILEEYWPLEGKHKIANGTFISVSPKWEKDLEIGEDEHVADAQLAVELTWQKVADTINVLSKQPGPPEASADAATEALWKRYQKALPDDLRPQGAKPSIPAQKDVLAVEPGTFFAWMWEATVVRDTRGNHFPKLTPKSVAGNDVVNEIEKGGSEIPGKSSPELLKELRAKYTPGRVITGSKLKKST